MEGLGLHRGRSLVVMFEIAAALVLLIGAGLLIKSLLRLKGPYADLDPENVVMTEITLDNNRYSALAHINLYWEDLLQRMAHLPGVRSVGAVANVLGDMWWMTYVGVTVEGHPTLRVPHRGAHCNPVTADYLQTMRIPLHNGRYFTEKDMKPCPCGGDRE
jgi:putative ABC transport system permease protein